MRACALGVGFGPFRFSEAHSRGLDLQSCAGVLVLTEAGESCEKPAALGLRRAVALVCIVVSALRRNAACCVLRCA